MYMLHIFSLILLVSNLSTCYGNSDDIDVQKCASCIKILDEVKESAKEDIASKNVDKFQEKFKGICKRFPHSSAGEKFCYSVGGREESPVSMMKELLDLSVYLPSEKICLDYQNKYGEICKDKVKIEINWDRLDKYPVKDLKKFLAQENDQCSGCTEKSEFIKRVLTHKPQEAEL